MNRLVEFYNKLRYGELEVPTPPPSKEEHFNTGVIHPIDVEPPEDLPTYESVEEREWRVEQQSLRERGRSGN